MPTLHRICLILLFLSASTQGWSEVRYAKPLQDFQVSYAVKERTLKLYPLTELKLQRQTAESVFVTLEEDETVFKLDRFGGLGRALFEMDGGVLTPLELIHTKVDQGWMLFSQSKAYQVVEKTGEELTLKFPRAGEVIHIKLPSAYFKEYSREELGQAIAAAKNKQEIAQKTASYDPPFSSNNRQPLSDAERNQQNAEVRVQRFLDKPPVPYHVATQSTDAACIVENARGSGSGFLAVENGRVYLYTNIHMLASFGGGLKAKVINGKKLELGPIELAPDRDLARIGILTPNLPALTFDYAPQMNETIIVHGNSSGGNVITQLKGKVLGIGPTEIEISAGVVHGNSGGPVLNEEGQVLAVVTHGILKSSSLMAQDTRFSKTRRFAARVSRNISWEAASYQNLLNYERALIEGRRTFSELKLLESVLSRSGSGRIAPINFNTPELIRWLKSHNYLMEAKGQTDDEDFRSEMAAVSRRLSGIAPRQARYYEHFKLYPENEYYRKEFKELAIHYGSCNDVGKQYSNLYLRDDQSTYSRAPSVSYAPSSTSNKAPIDHFGQRDKTEYHESGNQAYCMVVCTGVRSTDEVQIVFSGIEGASTISVDTYVNGRSSRREVTVIVDGSTISFISSIGLKDFAKIAKAYRREVHLGPKSEWAESYMMLGDRPLHDLIKFTGGRM